MLTKALASRALSPSNFGSWVRTRADFAAAIKAGPGLVALVGPEGSGKTYTLTAFALALDGQGAKLRSPGQPLEPGVSMDLVDGVDAEASERLRAEPEFPGIRALAVRPDLLAPLLLTHPGARVVRVGDMSGPDVRTMIETRRRQFSLPRDALTFKAFSNLDRFCGGNPRKLDRLFGRAERAARAAKSNRISGEHVAQANRDLAAAARGGPAWQGATAPHPIRAPVAEAGPDASSPIGPSPAKPLRDRPTEASPPAARTVPNAHAEMWALLATPSTRADVATARRSSRRPGLGGASLIGIGAVLAAAIALFASELARVLKFAGIAASRVERYVATMAETQPNRRLAPVQVAPEPTPVRTAPVPGVAPEVPASMLAVKEPMPAIDPIPAFRTQAPVAEAAAFAAPTIALHAEPLPPASHPAEGARLLALGKVLISIGQTADARALLSASARMGNAEAGVAMGDPLVRQ